MGKNVAVFVDVANIFYAAKAAGADIDYVLLLKAATAGRDLVRAYAYTGLDPDNENQRNFHSFLARNGYKVVSKDIRKYGDGKVKANLDIELVVDLMKTSRNLDVAVVVSGDGDFAPAIRAVQETGVRVEVISFRGNTSSDLMEVADQFTDITHLAKVEKGSTVSGRRVATSDEDLSMTEVPDKESEGTGRGRGRGRGRIRTERVEVPVEPSATVRARGRGRARVAAEPVAAEPVAAEPVAAVEGALVALPGEKLSKAPAARVAEAAAVTTDDDEAVGVAGDDESPADAEERRRRRRRRGGRGRGRGRGQDADQEQAVGPEGVPVSEAEIVEDEVDEVVGEPAHPAPRRSAFGSVWDSQIGVPSAPRSTTPVDDEEYDDEPAIPEYLLAERRAGSRGGQLPGQRGGQRGRGGSYAAAVDRERYGGGRGGSRLSEPSGRSAPSSNRPSEPSGRGGPGSPRGGPRTSRPSQPAPFRDRAPERRPSSEPWSEVPPELEELLRAQLAQKIARQEPAPTARSEEAPSPRRRTRTRAAAPAEAPAKAAAPAVAPAAPAEAAAPAKAPARTPRTRKAAAAPAEAPAPAAEAPAKIPARTSRTRKAAVAPAAPAPAAEAPAAAPKPARTPRTRKAVPAEGA